MIQFKHPKPVEGQMVLNDRYIFEDGVLTCSDSDGIKLEKVLVRFYGCTKVLAEEAKKPVEKDEPEKPTLKAEATKVEVAKK